jgi:Fe-S oxidoreductase
MMQPELAPTSQDAAAPMNFGAKDIFDLSWKNLMDAYSCTECGRCSAACPANMTGKKLSPRKIMMSTRDRLEEVGKNIDKNKEFIADEKHLLHDYITAEELRACTTCNACVEACPVSISPLDIIIQLRRNLVMEESNAPQEWNMMFGNIENNMAPWKFSPEDRDAWTIS